MSSQPFLHIFCTPNIQIIIPHTLQKVNVIHMRSFVPLRGISQSETDPDVLATSPLRHTLTTCLPARALATAGLLRHTLHQLFIFAQYLFDPSGIFFGTIYFKLNLWNRPNFETFINLLLDIVYRTRNTFHNLLYFRRWIHRNPNGGVFQCRRSGSAKYSHDRIIDINSSLYDFANFKLKFFVDSGNAVGHGS